jgi:hypothetical protein
MRYDILRYYCMVPYLEAAAEFYAGPVNKVAPSVEAGARFHFAGADLSPFFRWAREQEALTYSEVPPSYPFIAKNSLLAGVRAEVLLDGSFLNGKNGTGWQFLPEIHGTANYALFSGSQNFKGRGDVELDLEMLRYGPWTVFLYSDMFFDSRKQDFKPNKVDYWLQYGLTYRYKNYFIEAFVKDGQRLDANDYLHTQERFNLAGVRAGTYGMKPGHFNDGISFEGPTCQFINNWNGQVTLGHFFNNRDWQYLWNASAQVRWDLARLYFVIPYIQGEITWQSGGGPTADTIEYAAEPGLRFHGKLDLAFYYRFQHRANVLFFRGPSANENLIGVKVLF